MSISSRRLLLAAVLASASALSAVPLLAQDSLPPTRLERQLAKFDLAVVAAGSLGTTVSGYEQRDIDTSHTLLTIHPSTTVGELATLRYTAHPYLGFEFNFSNLRYTQDYTFVPPPSSTILTGGAQAQHREMSLGYVAHLKYRPFGLTPYLGGGGGTIRFKPTPGGGQGLPEQYRAAYFYSLGVEGNFPDSHFGMRAGFRQLIYLAPDFLQNYLTITRRTRSSEPIVGFFVRF